MATPNSKMPKKDLKAFQKALNKANATIVAKGNGGFPAQATAVTTLHASWIQIPPR